MLKLFGQTIDVALEQKEGESEHREEHASKEEQEEDEEACIWMYKDPQGKEQGPFSTEQMKTWFSLSMVPLDLGIWKAGQSKDESRPISQVFCQVKRKRQRVDEYEDDDDEGSCSNGEKAVESKSSEHSVHERRHSVREREHSGRDREYASREGEDAVRRRQRPSSKRGILCIFYERGYCRNGENCPFIHHK